MSTKRSFEGEHPMVKRQLRLGYIKPLTVDMQDEKGQQLQHGTTTASGLTFFAEEFLWSFNLEQFALIADVSVDFDVPLDGQTYKNGVAVYHTDQLEITRIRTLAEYFSEISVFILHDMARAEAADPRFFVQWVPLHRSDFWTWYVRRRPEVLVFMQHQPESLCELAVSANPAAVLAVQPSAQTERLWMLAVQQDPRLVAKVPPTIMTLGFKTRLAELIDAWFKVIPQLLPPTQ